jgi:hypothetical protein
LGLPWEFPLFITTDKKWELLNLKVSHTLGTAGALDT